MYRFFYIPYLYTYKAKLLKKGRLFSYILIFIFPPAYFALVLQTSVSVINAIYVILGLIITQNLYEIGYIQNDAETIKKESNPTYRLNKDALNYYGKHCYRIYILRAVTDILLCLILLIITKTSCYTYVFLVIVHLIIPFFFLYNTIRNKWNLLLQLILSILKFSSVQFLFLDTFSLNIFLLSIAIYPVVHLIDRLATPRYMYKFSQYYIPRTAKFRAAYYLFFCLICFFLYVYGQINIYAFLIAAYFFAYRLLIVILKFK
jgi:hypothetical protein